MTTSVIQPSFAAGELSPTLYGRVDLAKYKVGAALMRNLFVDYRGGASNRPGTKFVGQCKFSDKFTRLIPFKFSVIQTYVLEFGDLYMRVIKDGEYVLEDPKTIVSITQANPAVVTVTAHGFQPGDWVYLAVAGMTQVNQKTFVVDTATTDTFTLVTLSGASVNSTTYSAFTSGTVARYYTLTTPWPATALEELKYFQSADVVTLCHPNYVPYNMTRTGNTNWILTPITFTAGIAPPTGASGSCSAAGTTRYSYQVTAVSGAGEESIGSNKALFTGVNISTTAGTNTITWGGVSNAEFYNIYRANISDAADIPIGATHAFVGMSYGLQFLDTNITPDFTKTPPIHANPFAPAPLTKITVSAGGSGYVANTTVVGITDPTGSGAVAEAIVISGAVVGILLSTGGQGYTAPVITIGGAGTGATATATVGPATGTNPSTGCYFQQRKVFAASTNQPQTLWGTKPGAYANMDKSNPTVDSDAYSLTIASTQVNDIKFTLPMAGGLVVLTGGGAWQVTGTGGQNSAVTPSSATAIPQAYNGCHDHMQPIVVNYDILYVQAKGSIVRDLSYNFFTNIYIGIDISALSNHLFNPYTLIDWGYAEEPFKLIWVVRNDGKLLSLTYIKEQEVYGWAQHDTQGEYKSVAVIQEGNEDVPYFIVKRLVNGSWVQYVEQMQSRVEEVGTEPDLESAWFVDCALQYPVNRPAADLVASAAAGTITLTASAGVFSGGDVGKIFRGGNGKGIVTAYTDATHVTVELYNPITKLIPDDPGLTPLPIDSGEWSLQTLTSTVSGLDHLEGCTVQIMGDGNSFTPAVVTNGAVSMSQPCSMIVVGLGYTSQLQTLYLDAGSPDGGTMQGKRKKIAATTVRVVNTKGLKIGPNFNQLIEFKPHIPTQYGQTVPLFTGDERIIMDPAYTVGGQICIQQDYPFPITVLAVVPEIEMGDTR